MKLCGMFGVVGGALPVWKLLVLLGLDQVVGAEQCPLLLALCFRACVLRSLSAWGDITKVHVGLYLGLLCL